MPDTNSDNLKRYTVHIISHTHWDREWYAPFQEFRYRLIRVIDGVLKTLTENPQFRHFNLDGQTIILRDYLEIRPEMESEIGRLVRDRRLGVGPWFVLPDEFLVSGESLIRNLLLGSRIARQFGHVQKVGYIPDTFGHIGQLPQILAGFDIHTCMHFRGVDEGNFKAELWWRSPDGSSVLLHHLPNYVGYASAAALAVDHADAVKDLHAISRKEAERAVTRNLLAMSGVDHLPIRPDLPDILRLANQDEDSPFHYNISSLEEFFDAVTEYLIPDHLQVICGELRQPNRTPGSGMRVLPDILSSRMYNKLQNEGVQTLLERWAEPLSALMWLGGMTYPAGFLWKAWEYLLENHAHDSIGGCSVDAVHDQMETRFSWAQEIAEAIVKERLAVLAAQVDLDELDPDEVALLVFNPLPYPRKAEFTTDIDFTLFHLWRVAARQLAQAPQAGEDISDRDAGEIFRWRTHHQWAEDPPLLPETTLRGLSIRRLGESTALPVQFEGFDRTTITRPLWTGPGAFREVLRVRASFPIDLPACGYQVYAVKPEKSPVHYSLPGIPQGTLPHHVMENQNLRVEIAPNGTFRLIDRHSGQTFTDLGYFEDGGDVGDGYNYSFPLSDQLYTTLSASPRISRLSAGPVVQAYRIAYDLILPVGLEENRFRRAQETVVCPLTVTLKLGQSGRGLEIDIEFENRARDHRLRMIFPSDVDASISHASAQFDVVSHPIAVVPVPQNAWTEDAPLSQPMQGWLDLSSAGRALCVAAPGLPEYEVMNTSRREVAVTLLRAVKFLGAGTEIRTANIGAGPNIPTPGAQIQRRMKYRLALFPHTGRWDEDEIWRAALTFQVRPQVSVAEPHVVERIPWAGGPELPDVGANRAVQSSFVSIEGKNIILSALKKSENQNTIILRLYNPSESTAVGRIQLAFDVARVELVNLEELPLIQGENGISLHNSRQIDLEVPPHRIISLQIYPAMIE